MQKYPRGSRGSPAKGVVWETVARVRISSSAPKTRRWIFHFRVFYCNFRRDSRVGAVLREQNALPYGNSATINSTAKDNVDNVGAGRAAKGENLVFCAKKVVSIGYGFFIQTVYFVYHYFLESIFQI